VRLSKRHAIEMPDVGDVAEAVVVQWLCSVGDEIKEGDDLLEVETSKTTFVVPAPMDGVLQSICADAGTRVLQGMTLGWLSAA